MKKEIKAIISFTIILLIGAGVITGTAWIVSNFKKPEFERGYYEGYKQGLSKDYWTGWEDCRRYFKENPEKLEL